ncbi:MAG: nucleotide sugar dehydrogenase [Endomicrobium sp.]|jgi:UDP-N-acetyl-D-mannosaminuronic acid dehydrogenase|nr:nucleotide sugar dehydrogenase [Endomicrobium sp.]
MQKICIIGGCGHVGIPLGLAFASKNFNVTLLDINKKAVDAVNSGTLPFIEDGAQEILSKHIGKNLFATNDENVIKTQDAVVFVTGTPVDEHLTPKIKDVLNVIKRYRPLLNKNQLIVLRSTIFPGTTEVIDNILADENGQKPMLAFCPERIVQGKGIEEIFTLPQLVSAVSEAAYIAASELFLHIAPKIIRLEPKEAEIAKLMTNSWRYLEFAIANQFYMMIESEGLDFYKIYNAMRDNYPRAQKFPKPGLAAGPCLFKDTMQLSVFNKNNFTLGQSGMQVNEGLADFLVERLEQKIGSLKGKTIAILGMTFKPNNDDVREALSFRVKKRLEFKMANVLPCDPYLKEMIPLDEALKKADGIILGMPHDAYRDVKPQVPYVDCWDVWRGVL